RSYADSSTTNSNSFNDNSNYQSDSSSTNVDSFNQVHMDTDMVVASSSLMGGVTGASVIYATNADDTRVRVENINTLGGLGGAAGITTVGQNAGSNSLVQQSVTTNASVFTGGE
ncbi:dentin sialophosphoprotein, partial [Vibrio parahaemolyticus]|nr:dentin sialophosphoprotein [Vibrio parahaemolyticus]